MKYAIIPARAGSKRIPKKNIKEFMGVPMIERVIKILQETEIFDEIVVSTDGTEIAKVAERAGALVPFIRPSDLSDDYAGTAPVIAHAVNEMNMVEKGISSLCCVYSTAVLLRSEDLHRSLEIFQSGKWKYVFSAAKYDTPVQRSFIVKESSSINMLFPDEYNSRSQDLEPVYYDAGMFYWASPQTWLDKEVVFSEHSSIVDIPSLYVQDIDTLDDFVKAERKFISMNT